MILKLIRHLFSKEGNANTGKRKEFIDKTLNEFNKLEMYHSESPKDYDKLLIAVKKDSKSGKQDRCVNNVWIDRMERCKGNSEYCQKHFETITNGKCGGCLREAGLIY